MREGLTASSSIAARVRFRARHLWIMLAAVPFERRAYVESRLVLYNYDSVLRLIRATYDVPRCLKVPYCSESVFRPPAPKGPVPTPVAGLKPAGAPLVVAVSRHQPRKGVDVLLRALKILSGNGVAFRACLLGDGELLGRTGPVRGPWPLPAPSRSGSSRTTGIRHATLVLPRARQSGSLAYRSHGGRGPAVASPATGIPRTCRPAPTPSRDAGEARASGRPGKALEDEAARAVAAAAARPSVSASRQACTEAWGRRHGIRG